mmetsp:Transcript_59215/g.135848  ORF Transcript_59215/g.135848 Transcript_59215/m.135848 type:complete len:232 (-) Transcript_59215:47-742(-)
MKSSHGDVEAIQDDLEQVGRLHHLLPRLLEIPQNIILAASRIGLTPRADVSHDVTSVRFVIPCLHGVIVSLKVGVILNQRRGTQHEVACFEERIVHALVAHIRLHNERVADTATALVCAFAPFDAHRRLRIPIIEQELQPLVADDQPIEFRRARFALRQRRKPFNLRWTATDRCKLPLHKAAACSCAVCSRGVGERQCEQQCTACNGRLDGRARTAGRKPLAGLERRARRQ